MNDLRPDDRVDRLVHDLRTPLTIVAGFAEILLKGDDRYTPEERTDHLMRICDAAKEMRAILDDARPR